MQSRNKKTKPNKTKRGWAKYFLLSSHVKEQRHPARIDIGLLVDCCFFFFLPLFGTYARKTAKANSDSETLVLRVERKYGRVRNMEVQVGGLRFKRFFLNFLSCLYPRNKISFLWFHILPINDPEVIPEKEKTVELYNISNNLQVHLNILFGNPFCCRFSY